MQKIVKKIKKSDLNQKIWFFRFFFKSWSFPTLSPSHENKSAANNATNSLSNHRWKWQRWQGSEPSMGYLRTDSTKTRRALTWIHAMNASPKFTFSHRTSGPFTHTHTHSVGLSPGNILRVYSNWCG